MAVDGYGWLHKGAYTCSTDLCLKRPTDKFVTFFLHRLQVLINHGLVPTIVFDGGQLPMKREENESRRSSRKQNYDKAMSLWKVGKQVAAEEYFQRAVHIGPDHAKQVIDALKLKGVHYIVAPYEADSQMAFLAQSGRVDLVITEDSDLLAYSCPEVLFKLDKEGNVQHVCFDELIKSSKFAGFTKLMFTEMCILSGCDFLQSVPGIGMKRAYTFIKKLRSHSAVIKRLKYSGFKVPSTYELDFRCALKVFHHQTVWDPLAAGLRHLTPLGEDMAAAQEAATDEAAVGVLAVGSDSESVFLGAHYSKGKAKNVAAGNLHPHTLQKMVAGLSKPGWFEKELSAVLPIPKNTKNGGTKRGEKKERKKGDTWFDIQSLRLNERKGTNSRVDIELKADVEPRGPSEKEVWRGKSVRMRLKKDQRVAMRRWMNACRVTYNSALDTHNSALDKVVGENKRQVKVSELRKKVVTGNSELLTQKPGLKATPECVRSRAVSDLRFAFTTNFAKVKKQKEEGRRVRPFEVKHRSRGRMSGHTVVIDRKHVSAKIDSSGPVKVQKLGEKDENKKKIIKRVTFCPKKGIKDIRLREKVEVGQVGGVVRITRERGGRFTMHTVYKVKPEKAVESSRVVALDPGARTFQTVYGYTGSGWNVGKCGEGAGETLTALAEREDKRRARMTKLEKEIRILKREDDKNGKVTQLFIEELVRKIEGAKTRTLADASGGNKKKMKKKRKNEKRIAKIQKLMDTITRKVERGDAKGARELVCELKKKLVCKLKRASRRDRQRSVNLTNELHRKTACWLFHNYDMVLLPEFKVRGMIKKERRKIGSKTARALMSLRHYAFRQHMTQKAERLGKKLVIVDESLTSKTCGTCGLINWGLGGAEKFKCPSCRYECDRDENAARNILLKNFKLKEGKITGSLKKRRIKF